MRVLAEAYLLFDAFDEAELAFLLGLFLGDDWLGRGDALTHPFQEPAARPAELVIVGVVVAAVGTNDHAEPTSRVGTMWAGMLASMS